MSRPGVRPPARRRQGELQKTRAYDQLLVDIIHGEFPPGSPLDELALSRRYRAGRAAVRDALSRLSFEGFVRRWPRVGTTVAEIDVIELQQVYEARAVIEAYCASLAAQYASSADIAAIRGAFDGRDQALARRDFRVLTRMDQAFHQGVARATHNPYLLQVVTLLHNHALRLRHRVLPRQDTEVLRVDIENHLAALGAIERREPARAAETMQTVLAAYPERLRHPDIAELITGRPAGLRDAAGR